MRRILNCMRGRTCVLIGIFSVMFVFTFLVQKNIQFKASAANLVNFDAGNIISDYQMSDYNSMSEAEIQNFLSSKNNCGNRNYSYYQSLSNGHPNITWHWADGHFVCLPEERFGDGEVIGSGDTAAHIIWQAAQDYRINPKVLIVLLQKETGLITDPIPNNNDYRKAAGYGCPDTAACSSKYYGFKNQVRNAAALFRTVLDGGWTNYPVGSNYIQYSPDSSCGGSWINIQNRATSALYRYTPYQPNSAALNAGYGTGNSCSSYGNRNFYSYYEDWFGGSQTVLYKTVDIPDGVYTIQSALNNSKAIDVDGNKTINGTNVQIWDLNVGDAQRWEFTRLSDGVYKIVNATTGMALDLSDANTKDGSNIQVWSYNGTCAQRWKLLESGSNVVIASTCATGSVIDVSDVRTTDGTNIQLQAFNGSNAQRWDLMPAETTTDGLYYIRSSMNGNKVVDINGGAVYAKNGTNIQLWDLNETTAQYWRITRGSDGYYTVTNPNTGKVLDVANAGTTDGTNLQLWGYNGTCAQKWRILKKENKYTFISACSYKVVDVNEGRTANGTNIQMFKAKNSDAQKWELTNAKVYGNMENVTLVSALNDNKVLDVAWAETTNGANIHLWDYNGTKAQKWDIIYDNSDNSYKIVSKLDSNKTLDVAWAGTTDGTNLQLWSYNGTCAQKWHIMQVGDYYTFRSTCSEKTIDVAWAGIVNGTNVHLWSYNGSKAQLWKIKR